MKEKRGESSKKTSVVGAHRQPNRCADDWRASRAQSARKRPSLGHRIVSWSSNLLAISVVIILGLTFGKQVVYWWRGAPPPRAIEQGQLETDPLGLATPLGAHWLTFGDLPLEMRRVFFEGDESAAAARLRELCRPSIEQPGGEKTPAIPVHQQLLEQLLAREAIEQGPGWRIIQHVGPVITVVALQMGHVPGDDESVTTSQTGASVVSWAVGLRGRGSERDEANASRWTLLSCSGRNRAIDAAPLFSLPIPPGGQSLFSLRIAGGGALQGYADGPGVTESRVFFDRHWERRGWSRVVDWTSMQHAWHVRFHKRHVGVCDLQLVEHEGGGTTGILTMTPTAGGEVSE